MNFKKLTTISETIAERGDIVTAIHDALDGEAGKHWIRDLNKLAIVAETAEPQFSIFTRDNLKLPFLSFSALPGAPHCPGAGDCLVICYSFKAWRYPAAFARQAQNAILLQSFAGRCAIRDALDTFEQSDPLDFRLYVDGDFSSFEVLRFWMEALSSRAWLRCYGYSKSFKLLLEYDRDSRYSWPDNYLVNLSSGHNSDAAIVERMRALPITRGEFIAVDIGKPVKSADHGGREHNKLLRLKFGGAKAFTCPGKCGECTPKGHACGSRKFAGIPVIIAAH